MDINTLILDTVFISSLGLHIRPQTSCSPSEIRRLFIAPTKLPAKLFFSRSGEIEEIPDDDPDLATNESELVERFNCVDETIHTTLFKMPWKKHKDVKNHYIVIFDDFPEGRISLLPFLNTLLCQYMNFRDIIEEKKVKDHNKIFSCAELLTIDLTATSTIGGNQKMVIRALQNTTKCKWFLKETVPNPLPGTNSFENDGTTERRQNNHVEVPLHDIPVPPPLSTIYNTTMSFQDYSSFAFEDEYLLTTNLGNKGCNVLKGVSAFFVRIKMSWGYWYFADPTSMGDTDHTSAFEMCLIVVLGSLIYSFTYFFICPFIYSFIFTLLDYYSRFGLR